MKTVFHKIVKKTTTKKKADGGGVVIGRKVYEIKSNRATGNDVNPGKEWR